MLSTAKGFRNANIYIRKTMLNPVYDFMLKLQ